jgi:hypothetical protein
MGRVKKCLLALMALPGTILLGSLPAAAQCAMCYASAAAAGGKGIHALKLGILVLAIPTIAIFAGLIYLAFRYRNSYSSWQGQSLPERLSEQSLFPLPIYEGDSASRP